jgi:tRNA threonylcarbamoyladenosine biosynthesis protein TsaE
MSQFEIVSHSPEETQRIGRRLGELARPGDVVLLIGNLGAGKTCLTQGIAFGLGITEYTASPSFILVRELYGRLPLYHIDFYRLENLAEIAELGLDEYLYGGGVCVVEWADRAPGLLPEMHLRIDLTYIDESSRGLSFRPAGVRYEALVAALAKGM